MTGKKEKRAVKEKNRKLPGTLTALRGGLGQKKDY